MTRIILKGGLFVYNEKNRKIKGCFSLYSSRIKLNVKNHLPDNNAQNFMQAASARQCEVVKDIEPHGDMFD